MVTTAGLADSTITLGMGANRIIENGALESCTGIVINKTQGAYTLVMASADCNGRNIGLHFTAPGDVPLHLTFPTIAGGMGSSIVADAVWRAITASYRGAGNAAEQQLRLDSTVSSRMGATPLINNLDSAVSSRLGAGQAVIAVTGDVGGSVLGNVNVNVWCNVTGSVGSVVGAVGSVTGNVGGNVNGNVLGSVLGNVGGSVLLNLNGTVASIGTGAIAATSFTTAALNAIADSVLDRNMATGTDSGTETIRTPRQALRVLRNKVETNTTPGNVYKEDDTTVSFTFSITTAAGNPTVVFDPTD